MCVCYMYMCIYFQRSYNNGKKNFLLKVLVNKTLNYSWLSMLEISFLLMWQSTIFINYEEKNTLLDEHYYNQINGVAMGSPLDPTFKNIFLSHHEANNQILPKPSNQSFTKNILMTFFYFLKIQKKFYRLLTI